MKKEKIYYSIMKALNKNEYEKLGIYNIEIVKDYIRISW
jgi:hypothetical protein